MGKVPLVWTGPVKVSKRRKVNTVDPFYTGPKQQEKRGKPITDMSEENEHIPRSLRQMMEWQKNQEELEKKKAELKAARLAQREKATASVYLGDDNNDSESDSEIDEGEEIEEIPEAKQNNTNNNNNNNKNNKNKQNQKQNQQQNQKQTQKQNQKRKSEDNNSKQGEKKQKTEKGGQGKGKGNKKAEKEEEEVEEKRVQEFWELHDNVKFGETADRPPTITVRPRKAIKANVEYDAKKVAQERAREKAKLAYAASKKRKATNSGNKFFL